MFSSDYDGEIVNAARAAERLIKKCGETWESVIVNGFAHHEQQRSESPKYKPSTGFPAFHQEVKDCLMRENLVTAWEKQFLKDLFGRHHLSEKQRVILDRIKAKIAAYADMTW